MDLTGKTLLITGGTGSFGSTFIRTVLANHDVASVRVFSRDELKQYELDRTLRDPRLRLLIGDIRDRDRLRVATRGVDVIVHAAALKQVPSCEYNPFEAVQTNVHGAQNVVDAAIDGFAGTGNLAFDEHRAATLARLEEERRQLDAQQAEFAAFMQQLRRAKDQEEFDRFMQGRNRAA